MSFISQSKEVELKFSHKENLNSLKQTHKRQILNILVVGDQKVGKTSLINAIISNQFNEKQPATSQIHTCATEIILPSGNSKILLLTEIPLIELNSLTPEQIDKDYDLILACFERSSHLLRFLNENYQYLPKYVPKIGIHCKSDRENFEVYMSREDENEVKALGVKKIVDCSAKNGEIRDVLTAVYQTISKP